MRESDHHILAEHYLDFYQIAYRMLQNQTEAEDVVQEALARTFARPLVKEPQSYCVKVLRNCCLDRMCEKYMVVDEMDEMAAEEDDPFQQLLHTRLQVLEEARKSLPDRTNKLLDMYYVSGMSISEISRVSGFSTASIKKLFRKAYRQLRKKIIMTEIEVK